MAAYYNEIDSFCVEWLKNLITAKLIAAGDVDSRSITEVTVDDVKGYTQCHFFAGIAGWSYALRLAGVSDDQQVWTGSCPCQPFSNAGKRKGFDDERHLWPEFARLIGDCRPPIIFGEQVASKVGREWLSVVRSDLEALGYAIGAADLCAASVGAPHIRQRLWWVAYAQRDKRDTRWITEQPAEGFGAKSFRTHAESGRRSDASFLADSRSDGHKNCRQWADRLVEQTGQERNTSKRSRNPSWSFSTLEHAKGEQMGFSGRAREQGSAVGIIGSDGLPDIDDDVDGLGVADSERLSTGGEAAETARQGRSVISADWDDLEWFPCIDRKARPTKSGLFPLAHGIPGRVGRLRAYGNAIVPQVAAEFIAAAMEYAP